MKRKVITKRKFLAITNNNQPNNFIKWWYTWFAEGKNWKNRTWVWWMSISMSLLGFILTGIPSSIQVISSVLFLPLTIFVLLGFIAVPMNNYRIKNICAELNVSLFEYNILKGLYE